MADRDLTTRDLAGPSDPSDGRERSPHGEEPVAGSADERDELAEARAARNESEASTRQTEREPVTAAEPDDEGGPLLPEDQSERFTTRWQEIQASFVDRPRESVEEADALVADLMQRLAAGFSNEREGLEAQWDRGDDVSTEDLRVALTRYRSFFDRLLSA